MKIQVTIGISVVAVALGAVLMVNATKGVAKEAAPAAPRAALTVTTVKPLREKWRFTVPANGSFAAWQEAVIAAETGGLRINALYVDVGSVVKRGQKLAELAKDSVLADVEQQAARVAQAKAELALATDEAARARSLQGQNVMSDQLIRQYIVGQEKAQAAYDAAQAQLKNQKIRLEQTTIVAVDDGVISSRSATVGSVAQIGAEFFRMVRQNRIEWRAEVMADQAVNIKSGQRARVQLSNGESVEGTVRVTAPTFDVNTRKTLVYVDLPPSNLIRAGMFSHGEIILGASEALTLPQSALVLRDGFSYVFELEGDQRVAQRKITSGRRLGDRVEITQGLKDNAIVVANGGAFLSD
ncbi:MAG: efflux RND transporter periplasmic adaptor subunit, partial [Gammaproteobacteria bacterium]|nr:efflux RND transporter periplasmic adaptor subunit [Gammaproteobacteria bacterium]